MSLRRLLPASAFIMAALSGCSYFHFTSNVAPERFSAYFKASGVEPPPKEALAKRPDDVCNYTSRRGACQQFFEKFLRQKIPAGRVPGGDREAGESSF